MTNRELGEAGRRGLDPHENPQAAGAPPRVDGDRLLGRLRELAEIGRTEGGGITRPGFSSAAAEANAFVRAAAHDAGLSSRIDASGNLLLGRDIPDPTRRALVIGSHLDTVVDGGWLDGAYGVIAALETVQCLHEHGSDPSVDVVAVAFANEEGALFPQPFWGSLAMAGQTGALPREPVDYHGNPLGPALAASGGDLAAIHSAAWPRANLAGYMELHIEQGPILEAEQVQVGVVDAIVGRTVIQVTLHGVAAHAGTTPMADRHDPLVAAAELVTFVSALPAAGRNCHAATVGRINVTPNSANTIAGDVVLTVDLRDRLPDRLDQVEQSVHAQVRAIAARHDVSGTSELIVSSRPAAMDPELRAHITHAAEELSLVHRSLSSGAGHDAQIMAAVCPAAMIFVPSRGGASHVPTEDSSDADLVAGAELLLRSVYRVAVR